MLFDKLPPFVIGGAETQAIRLSKRLIQLNVNVIFITPGRDKIKGYGEIEGIPVYRLHSFLNYFWDLLSALKKRTSGEPRVQIEYDDATERANEVITPIVIGVRLRYLIFYLNSFLFLRNKKSDFDIIHVHSMEWPSFVGAWLAKQLGKRLVIKDATMNGINGLTRYPKGAQKLNLIIKCATFVAMTKAIHNNFIKVGVPKNQIVDIPNGIEVTTECKKEYSSKNRKVIFVGNLSQQPAKGVDILLKAWQRVIAVHPEASLLIVGDGPLEQYQDFLKAKSIDTTVRLAGKRNDVKALLIESDIFVLPSRREGMPNALMEAMLLGLPCVATNISGSQDLIVDHENGILVSPAEVTGLANAILFMMDRSNDAARMGVLARETIVTFNRMDLIANKYLSLYKKLMITETSKLTNIS
jgi:glycosyltransferase involved in cell wall biosynthesis